MLDLAGDVPAVVLSHLLGLHIHTTTDWERLAGARGADYAADLSRREGIRQQSGGSRRARPVERAAQRRPRNPGTLAIWPQGHH
jgi:hypothetical protein